MINLNRPVLLEVVVYFMVILSTLLVYFKMTDYGLKGGDFGYFHLLDEPYAGVFGGPIDDIPSDKNLRKPYLGHAVLGRTLEFIVEKVAGDRIRAYRFLEMMILILVNVLFYKMLKFVTKKPWLSLLGTLFLIANYPGFELYEQYAYFIERIPVIPFVLLGFIFWVKSFNEKNLKSYFLSLFFYISAILLGNFAILMFPLFIFYGVFKIIKLSQLVKTTMVLILKLIPIFLTVLIVVLYSSAGPSNFKAYGEGRRSQDINPLSFFIKQENISEKMAIQLTSVIVPYRVIDIYSKYEDKHFDETFREFMPYTIIVFISLSLFVLKTCRPSFRVIFLSAHFSLLSSLLINLYLDRVNFHAELGASRLYYIPYFFLSIIMAIIFYTLFLRTKSIVLRTEIAILIFIMLRMNVISIQEGINNYEIAYAGVLKTIDWARNQSRSLPADSVVFLPQPLGISSNFFFQRYYGKNITFFGFDQLIEAVPKLSNNSRVVILDFNEKYRLSEIEGLDITSREVSKSDLEKEYRVLDK